MGIRGWRAKRALPPATLFHAFSVKHEPANGLFRWCCWRAALLLGEAGLAFAVPNPAHCFVKGTVRTLGWIGRAPGDYPLGYGEPLFVFVIARAGFSRHLIL